jgi:hypothetical protein
MTEGCTEDIMPATTKLFHQRANSKAQAHTSGGTGPGEPKEEANRCTRNPEFWDGKLLERKKDDTV